MTRTYLCGCFEKMTSSGTAGAQSGKVFCNMGPMTFQKTYSDQLSSRAIRAILFVPHKNVNRTYPRP